MTYACLTLGQMGRNLGNPPFATRESLADIRRKELQQAAAVMGITDLRMMGYRDKTLEFEQPGRLKQMVLDLVAELKPSLVISFYPGYAVHPDHDATGLAVASALAELPKSERPTFTQWRSRITTKKRLAQPISSMTFQRTPFASLIRYAPTLPS